MKLFVVDTHGGARDSTLLRIDSETGGAERLQLGYVPEIFQDEVNGELLVVDTTFPRKLWGGRHTRCWLKRYSLRDLRLLSKVETPLRPMYTGYPGRSTRVIASKSGRYILHLGLEFIQRDPVDTSVYRLKVLRYDRNSGKIETGMFAIDSCTVCFGHMGGGDDDVYFHLSCDFPSTIAFGHFSSPDYELVRMIDLPARDHSPRETCGSWLDTNASMLYCIDGTGTIYRVRRDPPNSAVWRQMNLRSGQSIALQQIHGGGRSLFVGVSCSMEERSLSLASEIWQLAAEDGRLEQVLHPPVPLLNFVASENGDLLAGASPYSRSVVLMDVQANRCHVELEGAGKTPAEVQFVC